MYPSYTNGKKERFVCRPSRERGVHDGYDRKKQCVKSADVWGIEKVWGPCTKQPGSTEILKQKRVTLSSKIFNDLLYER